MHLRNELKVTVLAKPPFSSRLALDMLGRESPYPFVGPLPSRSLWVEESLSAVTDSKPYHVVTAERASEPEPEGESVVAYDWSVK